jgi:hypothetical protein
MTNRQGMRMLLVVAMAGFAPLVAAQEAPHGALAVDEAQGYHFGFAHDHADRVAAERRALDECAAHGGQACRVVLSWAGTGCGAYRSVTREGFAYGWGIAGTRGEAEAIADRELAERSNGRLADNRAWACNAGTAPLAILAQEAPPAAATGPMTLLDKDGDPYEYIGPVRNGQPHGRGTAVYPTGDRYEGDFVEGKMEGRGVYTWPSGARYEGDWLAGEMHGQGTYRFRTGRVYVGELRDSKMHGYGREYDTDGGLLYEGQWRNGQRAD